MGEVTKNSERGNCVFQKPNLVPFGYPKDIFYLLFYYLVTLIGLLSVQDWFLGGVVDEVNSSNLIFLLDQTIYSLTLIGLTLFFHISKYNSTLESIGLSRQSIVSNSLNGIILGTLLWFLIAGVDLMVISIIGEPYIEHPYIQRWHNAEAFLDYFVMIASLGLLQPVASEIFFRGFLYKFFKTRYHLFLAVFFTNITFAVLHMESMVFIQIFLMGVFLTVIYERTGSLVVTIISLSTYNMVNLLMELP